MPNTAPNTSQPSHLFLQHLHYILVLPLNHGLLLVLHTGRERWKGGWEVGVGKILLKEGRLYHNSIYCGQ